MRVALIKSQGLILTLATITIFSGCTSRHHPKTGEKTHPPKLVVGIVVDQMRYDFLYRYWDKYGNGGFKRLLRDGYLCANTNLNYVPTYTGPGHAAIYTGTTPTVNGIVGNNWYDRNNAKSIYCVEDKSVNPVGSANKKEGQMSPRNLLTSTITDELRLASNMRSKVIGLSLKDRGSILPAGHSANAAYWYDGQSGNFISSTYYIDSLPAWVNAFNNERQPTKLLNQVWNPILPLDKYTESTNDNTDYEEPFKGQTLPVFPYSLWQMSGNSFDLLRETPFGNTYTRNFAEAAIKGEKMGQGDLTDFLTVSFSSTDYVGHRFGPNSVEIEDTYIRFDKELEQFLDFLDSYVGKDNVLVFLTADHGVVNVPAFLKSKGLNQPAGLFKQAYITDTLAGFLNKTYNDTNLVLDYENQQIYLNYAEIKAKNISMEDICQKISAEVKHYPGVANVVAGNELEENEYTNGQLHLLQNGFMPSRSGDVAIVLQPSWIEGKAKGTTHGSGYSYDTHIPLIFYGWKIRPGVSYDPVSVTDIAPTLAAMLQIQAPNGCTGKPISPLVRYNLGH